MGKIVSKQQKSEAAIKEKPKSNFYGKKDTKEGDDMEKNLFGSDSDSDWGDMDGKLKRVDMDGYLKQGVSEKTYFKVLINYFYVI